MIVNTYGKIGRFEIRDITFVGEKPTNRPKYEYDVICWAEDHSYCWSIARLWWNDKESGFEFESIGTRYLRYADDTLNKWLLKWCELQTIAIENERENE